MKENTDLVRGWLRKAQSDLVAMDTLLNAGSLDAAAFHAQQAAEKYIKAFLLNADAEFPYTHNLERLVEICRDVDPSFEELADVVESLTPYAVELRYDAEFWPSDEEVKDARSRTLKVRDFVVRRLPSSIVEGG